MRMYIVNILKFYDKKIISKTVMQKKKFLLEYE